MQRYFRGYRVTVRSSLQGRGWRPEVSVQSVRLPAAPATRLSPTGSLCATEDAADEYGFDVAKHWIESQEPLG